MQNGSFDKYLKFFTKEKGKIFKICLSSRPPDEINELVAVIPSNAAGVFFYLCANFV